MELTCLSTRLQDFAGATLTAAYQNDGGAAAVMQQIHTHTDFAIAISPEMVEGLTLGYATLIKK